MLYKNELLQIDQVEHDNDLSQKPFLSSSILDRKKAILDNFDRSQQKQYRHNVLLLLE